ncbi:MAG TPA: zinc dependent phospholipase C family protein [Longimicrobiales bacterium]|nr:zinc dependent phospholipase C family protein [Longimicrobiales bacterium]
MPQPGLHLLLADEALTRWKPAGAVAQTLTELPFDSSAPAARNAFLHGALAPDMGFFPGGPQPLSEVVHEEGSSRMLRALLERAQTAEQRAYAWGWLTHVLADVLLHPIVNAGADELAEARGVTETADWLVAHVQIEVGLDATHLQRGVHRRLRLEPALDERSIEFVADAFADVYDLHWSPVRLAAVHRNVTRFTNACLPFVAMVGRSARADRNGGSFWTPTRHLLARWVGRRAPAHGFLVPILPTRDLLHRVAHARRIFHTTLDSLLARGVGDLPDYDLDRGLPLRDVRTEEPGLLAPAIAVS